MLARISPFFQDYRDELGKHNLPYSTGEPFGFLRAHDLYAEIPLIHTTDHMFVFRVERDFGQFLADILASAFDIPAGRAY